MEKNDNATEVSNTGTKNGEWKIDRLCSSADLIIVSFRSNVMWFLSHRIRWNKSNNLFPIVANVWANKDGWVDGCTDYEHLHLRRNSNLANPPARKSFVSWAVPSNAIHSACSPRGSSRRMSARKLLCKIFSELLLVWESNEIGILGLTILSQIIPFTILYVSIIIMPWIWCVLVL